MMGPHSRNDRVQVYFSGDQHTLHSIILRGQRPRLATIHLRAQMTHALADSLTDDEREALAAIFCERAAPGTTQEGSNEFWLFSWDELDEALSRAFIEFLREVMRRKAIKALAK